MTTTTPHIIYTQTDEAPALATRSLLPIIQVFVRSCGVLVETRDISLAGRILAQFPDYLKSVQRQSDTLAELAELTKSPAANIIKLPNVSASIPQLKAAIKELQEHGYAVPDYPEEAVTETEKEIKSRYAKVLGSAVNPVLREGNSDRRVAIPVKEYARKHPHSMGAWQANSASHVAHMTEGDFYGSEKSVVMNKAGSIRIEVQGDDGSITILKEKLVLLADEIIDASVLNVKALRAFYAEQIDDAQRQGVLFSLHLKATMMKVSDPIMFGHAVSVFFEEVFVRHAELLQKIGFNQDNGLGDLYNRIQSLPESQRAELEAEIAAVYRKRPDLAMVDSDKGITNLHVPSDVIVDASMPAAIRTSGQMWGPDGKARDTKFTIPDRCYAGIYQETIRFCKEHGAFDPRTMGSVANVGLMAQKAEEYGSHDKTFKIPVAGTARVVNDAGTVLIEHPVEKGDIWRMCQTKDAAIRDWVKLAVSRTRATGVPAVFWLDPKRGHDANIITRVEAYLKEYDTSGLELPIMDPVQAIRFSMERARDGKDTISVTGNVLRDYLTDLFPILELGTSAKMLSIVPLLAGGGLYETGAGGSAPKHVQQFNKEGHLRWDSLGEFLALGVSLEDLGAKLADKSIEVLAVALNDAISKFLDGNKSPSRKVNELDNRGSHFYLALYWAEALAAQNRDSTLQQRFAPLAKMLRENEGKIVAELAAAQGKPVDIGGYYQPDTEKVTQAMRPSATLNAALASLS